MSIDTALFAERALLWIVLLPLIGAVLNGVFGTRGSGVSKKLIGQLATGSVAVSFVLSIVVFARLIWMNQQGLEAHIENHVYDWFSVQIGGANVPVRVAFVADALSGVMLLVVTGIGTLIHVYSQEYMADDPSYGRFFTYLNLFTASMLILILGSSLPLMFVGWEGVGLCSYLLIGFWYDNPAYAAAGRKAFVVNRIGDFGVLIGTFILLTATQSFEFAEINARAEALTGPYVLFRSPIGMTATIASLFLFLGCAGKSAQIPLYVWLPDAMAGPTPVSALIHAATMVTAGVYLCCRLSAVFVLSPTAMAVIAIIGTLTALLAASIALVQTQMKKILAYSTVSQLGFMFAAVGTGAFAAGIFHVFTHAFFKACLFLGAGAVMHAVHAHGDADVRKLGGLAKKLPYIRWTFLFSCLAIAGVPPFSGFFSKDEILLGTLTGMEYFSAAAATVEGGVLGGLQYGLLVVAKWFSFGGLVVAATMTAYYMFRLYFLTFSGEYRSAGHEGGEADPHGYDRHPHQPGFNIRMVLVVLGAGAVGVGFLGFPHVFHLMPNLWGDWLHDGLASIGGHGEAHGAHGEAAHGEAAHGAVFGVKPEWVAMGAGTVAMLVGIGLAFVRFSAGRSVPAAGTPTGFASLLWNKWWVDELYDATVLRLTRVSAVVSGSLDNYVVDGLLTRLSSGLLLFGGWALTRLQSGRVHAYGVAMVIGLLGVSWWFLVPRGALDVEVNGATLNWSASKGFGYTYRWDLGEGGAGASCRGDRCTSTIRPADYTELVLLIRGAGRGPTGLPLKAQEVVIGPARAPIPSELVEGLGAERAQGLTVHSGFSVRVGEAVLTLHEGAPELSLAGRSAIFPEGKPAPTLSFREGIAVVELAGAKADRVSGGEATGPGRLRFASGGSLVIQGLGISLQRAAILEKVGAEAGSPLPFRSIAGAVASGTALAPGEGFQAAQQSVRIGARVEGAVEVTNVFGATRMLRRSLVVEPPRATAAARAELIERPGVNPFSDEEAP